ncbi:MAG: MBG domain-containing protein [Isosphaeraceae bacterium]
MSPSTCPTRRAERPPPRNRCWSRPHDHRHRRREVKIYGDSDPAFTYQITTGNLVGSDQFTGALSRVSGENVGTYAIEQGSLALSSNYALSFVGSNLSITPCASPYPPMRRPRSTVIRTLR